MAVGGNCLQTFLDAQSQECISLTNPRHFAQQHLRNFGLLAPRFVCVCDGHSWNLMIDLVEMDIWCFPLIAVSHCWIQCVSWSQFNCWISFLQWIHSWSSTEEKCASKRFSKYGGATLIITLPRPLGWKNLDTSFESPKPTAQCTVSQISRVPHACKKQLYNTMKLGGGLPSHRFIICRLQLFTWRDSCSGTMMVCFSKTTILYDTMTGHELSVGICHQATGRAKIWCTDQCTCCQTV